MKIINKKFSYEDTHRLVDNRLEKKCRICENWFICTEEYFYKNKSNKSDGLHTYCKKCASIKAQQWQADNPERWHFNKFNFFKTKKFRIWSDKNNKAMREFQSEWRRNNKDKCKEYQNKRKMHKTHNITDDELNILYEYANYACMYCGMSEEKARGIYSEKLHKDHAYNNGSDGIENCVLCCKGCNSSKHTLNWDEWYTTDNKRYAEERYEKIKQWLEYFDNSISKCE